MGGGGDEGLVFTQVESSFKVYIGCSSEYVHIILISTFVYMNVIECLCSLICVFICLFMYLHI